MRDNNKSTSKLLTAAEQNNPKEMEKVLQIGSDINERYSNGNTVLHVVIECQNLEMLYLICHYKANLDIENKTGHTALQIIASRASDKLNLKIARVLIDKGAYINKIGPDGDTALHISACQNNRKLTEMLVQNGACLSTVNNNNKTAFEISTGDTTIYLEKTAQKDEQGYKYRLKEERINNSSKYAVKWAFVAFPLSTLVEFYLHTFHKIHSHKHATAIAIGIVTTITLIASAIGAIYGAVFAKPPFFIKEEAIAEQVWNTNRPRQPRQ